MNTRLIAIAGPARGVTFTLADTASIGREASNQVCVNDLSVSRRHCSIKREGEHFTISDLDSFNGTFVNGVPIKDQQLEHGDQIAIGDTLLLFLLHETEAAMPSSSVQLDDGNLVTRSTIRLQREEALYLKPESVLAKIPLKARLAHDLNSLLKISRSIAAIRNLETLERQLLESVLEVVPAERAAIVLVREGLDDTISLLGKDRKSEMGPPVRISRTVANQVLREGVAILSNDVMSEHGLTEAESLIASNIHSLICVPLTSGERVYGIIYLDTSETAVNFDEDHLQLLMAIAGIASVALENAQHVEWLKGENLRLKEEIGVERDMVGESPRMQQVYQLVSRIAPSDSTVLVRGESGTGKELAARAIHRNSMRAEAPFVAINCAALTETLLESELFGHERGAFTGAIAQKKGKLELAHKGTVFLDEIGELAPQIQVKLLRVLQEREFERVGGTHTVKIDVRVVAATNRNLEEAVSSGSFRQDLYYRLNVVSVVMPPLRERVEDIPLLANYFALKHSRKCKRRVMGLTHEARECLMKYAWPGNVRELENAIERAVVLGTTEFIALEDLPENLIVATVTAGAPQMRYYDNIKEAKKSLILKAIAQAGGSYTDAAKILGVHPNNLHRLIRTLDLKTALNK